MSIHFQYTLDKHNGIQTFNTYKDLMEAISLIDDDTEAVTVKIYEHTFRTVYDFHGSAAHALCNLLGLLMAVNQNRK